MPVALYDRIGVPQAARFMLKAVNNELLRHGHNARLERTSGYFYFFDGEATDWLDRRTRQLTTQ